MALIKCPECGGQLSDKAQACIHCGYPLQESQPQEIIWNGRDVTDIENFYQKCTKEEKKNFIIFCEYLEKRRSPNSDLKNILNPLPHEEYAKYRKLIASLRHKYGMDMADANAFTLEYLRYKKYARRSRYTSSTHTNLTSSSSQNVVHCPRCGSTSVTTEEQGYGLFGWIGASQKKNLCQKCGHKWWPGR